MAYFVTLLLRFGLSKASAERLAPLAAVLSAVVLVGLLWGGFRVWDWQDDRKAIQADRNAANANFKNRQVEAERKAGAAKRARDREDQSNIDKLEGRVDEANKQGGTAADDVWTGGLWDEPTR